MTEVKIYSGDHRSLVRALADKTDSIEVVGLDEAELKEVFPGLSPRERPTSISEKDKILLVLDIILRTGTFILENIRESDDNADMKKVYSEKELQDAVRQAVEETQKALIETIAADQVGLSLEEFRKLCDRTPKQMLEDADRLQKELLADENFEREASTLESRAQTKKEFKKRFGIR